VQSLRSLHKSRQSQIAGQAYVRWTFQAEDQKQEYEMKYAIVDGIKTEAAKGITGICANCGSMLIAKCGELRINHWAHKGERNCDPWWENETEWHRSWKGLFPTAWQEVLHFAKDGEKHIADVKTSNDWVLEFQHSYINPVERRSRTNFYGKIVWIVDGTRRKTDMKQFLSWISTGAQVSPKNPIFKASFPEECRLLKEWEDSNALVFFDFGQAAKEGDSLLWLVFPKITNGIAYVAYFSKKRFVELHTTGQFDIFAQNELNEIMKIIRDGIAQKNATNYRSALLSKTERQVRNIRRRGI